MLSEYRIMYENIASQLPGWEVMSKSDLCYSYIDNVDNPISDLYLAALLAKCIKKLEIDYNRQLYKIIPEEEYYDVLIESILQVIREKTWENPSSSLYQKENAPEIAINRCIKCGNINLYIFHQRDKRKLNDATLSLNALEESSSDGYFLPYEDEDITINEYLKEIIQKYFLKKEYIISFILDIILNNNVFSENKNEANFKVSKLKSCLQHLDIVYCKRFAKNYELSLIDVNNSIKYIHYNKLDKDIQKSLKALSRDKEIISFIHHAY